MGLDIATSSNLNLNLNVKLYIHGMHLDPLMYILLVHKGYIDIVIAI